ncbi:MAG: hypothetical protein ACI4MJ_05420 [Aristaeellaceae bacterium]
MKNTLLTILSILLAIVLAAGAVCLGAYRGWSQERTDALHVVSADADLSASLEERAMDAANLAVVAARHLPAGDADLTALRDIRAILTDASAPSDEKTRADGQLTLLAEKLAASLPQLDSVAASARDQVYIATLTRTLAQGADSAAAYAAAAQHFNDRLSSTLTGRLAMLLGVEPLSVQ